MAQTKIPKTQLDPTIYVSGGTDVAITDGGTGASTLPSGILKGAGTGAITAATAGTDYAPATSGSSILSGNGSGGFSNATIGSGLSFSSGTLSSPATYSLQSVIDVNPAPSSITTYGSSPGNYHNIIYSSAEQYTRLYIPRSGTITYVGVWVHTAITVGSSETSAVLLRVNNTTNYLISASVVTDSSTHDALYTLNTSISVSAGDFICLIWSTPNWVTPPGTVYMPCVVMIT